MRFRPMAWLSAAVAATLLAAVPTAADAGTSTVVNRGAITFPTSGPTPASPFPSTVRLFGADSAVTDVDVRLGDLSHTFPADLDIELVGPDGTAVPLMSDNCGGQRMVNATVFFDDQAASELPVTATDICQSGTFRPSNFDSGSVDDWAVPPTAASLGAFDGTNPNGEWQLYVTDDAVDDTGQIASGWALQVTTADGVLAVPGPGTNGSGPATVYPVELPVSGRTGTITDVDVTLPGLSHSFPDDLELLLVSPAGVPVLLMDDTCGGDDLDDVTLTFDDEATDRLHDSLGCSSGRFPPTSFAGVPESLPAPAPQLPYGDRLSAYDGASPNGTWRLFVFDDDDEDGGFLAQRPQLSITTVDVVAPDTSLTRHPHDTARRTALLGFVATEPGSRFECKVDRHQFRPCDSPFELKHLGVGRHRVSVRSVDLAGNVDPSPAVARWRVQRR